LDQRLRTGEPQCAEKIAQVGHGDFVMAADVDPSQKCDLNGHESLLADDSVAKSNRSRGLIHHFVTSNS
jgi:hypothetical protein